MLDEIQDFLAAKIAKIATWLGAATAAISGLSNETIGTIGGLLIGLGGMLVSWYYQRERTRIMAEAARRSPECATCPEREG